MTTATAHESPPKADLTLDALTRMGTAELEALYRAGTVPASFDALQGSPNGRMLAIVGPAGRGPARRLMRAISASRAFPWRGKSFATTDAQHGSGINRVRVIGDRYPFDTRVDPSAIDGKACILLDYDKPENPWFIRRIRDELRAVAPGLFLGPAMIVSGKPRLALYFAVEHSAVRPT